MDSKEIKKYGTEVTTDRYVNVKLHYYKQCWYASAPLQHDTTLTVKITDEDAKQIIGLDRYLYLLATEEKEGEN